MAIRGRSGPLRTAVRNPIPKDTGVALVEILPYPRVVMYSLAPAAAGGGGGGVLTVTDRGEDLANAATCFSHYSGAVPAANCYLVTAFGGWDPSNGSGTTLTVTDNFADSGGGAWNYVFDQTHNFGTAAPHLRCAWRKYGTGGTSGGEITIHGFTPSDWIQMGVWEVSGANSTSPIKQFINAETSLTSITNTLPAALATTNSMVITGYMDVGQDSYSAPTETGYTLEFHGNMGGDGYVCHFKNGSADQVTHFVGATFETANPNLGFAVEIW